MSQYSHSRIECFESCKFKYQKRYIEKIKTIPPTNADNALYVGQAIHTGIEKSASEALNEYFSQFPLITDEQINEQIKFEYLIPKVKAIIPPDGVFELPLTHSDFIGFIDYTSPNDDGTFDLWDFKYSNNIKNYIGSEQLHLYKYFFELQSKKRVRKLNYLFIPKVGIKQKKNEDLYEFRKRIKEELEKTEIKIVSVDYDPGKVIEFYSKIKAITETTDFPKEPNYLCNWCEFNEYCEKGETWMILPKNERRERLIDENPDLWIYADSYVGKSTFVDSLDDLLFANTDGNTDNTTSPVVKIADVVTVEGRMTKRRFAWDVFLELIAELEKRENPFKRICLDLVEDLYEHCRLYKYDELKIEHEQDAGYGKGWDMVRTEFLTAMKRLKNLGYQIIYISKEVPAEVTLKNGSKVTVIKPNLPDKVANVLAGTVDLTVRAYMDGEERYLQLEKKENVFGGGRFNFKVAKIRLNKEEFLNALREAQAGIKTRGKDVSKSVSAEVKNETSVTSRTSEAPVNQPERRTRRTSNDKSSEPIAECDKYFYHPESDSYWILKKGEVLANDPISGLSNEVSKEEYEKGILKQNQAKVSESTSSEPVQPEVRKTRKKRGE